MLSQASTTTTSSGNGTDPAQRPCSRTNQTGGACKENVGWRRIVRNFTPSEISLICKRWFAVNMGTGIVSILLYRLPYNGEWLQYISYIFFCANVLLFALFTAVSVLRYTLYPEIWFAMIAHPGQSLFLGCFPMAFATIINMMVFVGKSWGNGFIYLAWAFWWADAVISMATCISMPFIVMKRHRPDLQNITAALLLPIVPTVVAAASAGIVAEVLPDVNHALTTLVAGYVLWGIGIAFSGCVLALYLQRLMIHSLPAREVIVSVFLPIGPLGQGGFGIQQLGKVALKVIPETNAFPALGADVSRAGEVLYVLGIFNGLVMWGFALVWLAFALISIITTQSFPFNMGWWGFTFPLGVLATCTSLLAENLQSQFFQVATMILSLSVVLLWAVVAVRTMLQVITGEMFFAPCLGDIRPKEQAGGEDRRV
ncbi:unnamed protein product [Clonostachys byssicola]|uniref:Sulfite efflux pump SSU1 n=1 Tax=Clonostachys byssicola TaxID=160290 RepID=A0A9N9YAN4_9HYPO|nr:unnamed protein product [Clonostachys byssicola]